ncbi:ribosome recycling factor [Aureibacter tunicatorum]|uniref:Ribosome-recycling factor n=1 Tax=Aureibacter tunicatorum TaxID=866807 RepID=A0AAE3XHM3_9BACT|nr:ribosome recycling factor [Aureibacter tunicatorum]MDR6237861.1 ribosome recycling factor [Aureibacter tunicatorum]BDD02896.1 ribosome-recycling factor [Aureibacter tunicatorum]
MEEIELFLSDAEEQMQKAVSHTQNELGKIRAGKAMPSMLDGVKLDYYGTMSPISQVASINTPDARTIVIKPWEAKILSDIERAIINSDLGLNPQNDGEIIRLSIPPLTEERRKDLVKQVKSEGENGKIRIRRVRQDTNDSLKKLQKEGASEDAVKSAEDDVQKYTNSFIAQIDDLVAKKEEEIMTI